ncbi:MAG: MFS transporter [Microbacterium sp.]|uniref:MFS transporter n=1 Tax=Microbacterium sp. TaxID=51671 RepID=UPI0039E572C1
MASSSSPLRRVIASSAIGQFVEWYDFVIYAYSASIIAKLFFPSEDPVAGVLSTFAVYAVGFAMRPLGGIVFGLLGDKIGRRRLLMIVIILMGAGTMGIGILPTYQDVGILAPILLVLCRMVQGFSAAGETAASNAFVAEHAPPNRRGLYVSFTYSFSTSPSVVAALVVLALMNGLGTEAYEGWGWRIAFLIGGPMALVGFYIRNRVDESPVFEAAQAAHAQAAAENVEQTKTSTARPVALVLSLAALSALAFYTLSGYMVSYLTTGAGLDSDSALLTNGIALLVAFVFFWVGGALSDRFGRRPILYSTIIATIVLYLPAFWLAGLGTAAAAMAGQLVIAIVFGVFWGAFGITVVELFPTRNRLSGTMISWALAYALFGGTAPLLSTWLIATTGLLIAPGIYVLTVAVVSLVLIIALRLPETSRSSLLHVDDQAPQAEAAVR